MVLITFNDREKANNVKGIEYISVTKLYSTETGQGCQPSWHFRLDPFVAFGPCPSKVCPFIQYICPKVF